ncbi:MAG: hypothetical protein ACJ72O_11105 [Marmoricola sp.]
MDDENLRLHIIREILTQAVAASERREVDLPHLAVCTDRLTGVNGYWGPFPDAITALTYAEREQALDRSRGQDPLVTWSVSALHPPDPPVP